MNSSNLSFRSPSSWPALASEFSRRLRGPIDVIRLIFIISLVNLVLYHRPLYSFAVANLDGLTFNSILTLITLSVVVFIATAFVLFLLALITQKLLKPICMLMFLINSVAVYFVLTYQAVLDKSMMGNVFNTDFSEASSYLHLKMLLYFFVLGVLPCWFLLKIRIQGTSRLRLVLFAFITLLVGLGWIYFASSTWLWIDKNAKKLGGIVMPWSYVANSIRYQTVQLRSSREQTLLPPATFTAHQKTVVILVIGEAARAQNFSLYGYRKPTNPLLAEAGVIALKNSVACSTYTTASLRCILSHTNSSSGFSKLYEPLPSYLQRHGVDVVWRSNNWGEPPMQVESYQRVHDIKQGCSGSGCDHDEVLLNGLSERIRSSKQQNIFVVLHQRGSHGPSYYAEYPKQFEAFKPVCKSVELNQCTDEELLNAYDNTILYTDYFLSRAIDLLKSLVNIPTMLMYISDHGESLGEHGLYLHGTPLTIAPKVQKEIPFIVWMSREFMDKEELSVTQIKQQDSHSQENVFHSVMGAFDMRSDVYDARLDIFNGISMSK